MSNINIWQLRLILLAIGFGPIQNGFALAGTNLLSPLLESKYWYDEYKDLVGIVDAMGILGMAIGSLCSGPLMTRGRRKTLILGNMIGLLSIVP